MLNLSRWLPFILLTLMLTSPAHAQTVITSGNASTLRLQGAIGYGYINSASTSPTAGTVAVATGNGLWLFDAGYTNPRQIHLGAVNDVAWRTDGTELAGALVDGTVRVWDAVTLEERLQINAHVPAQPDKDQPTGATVVIWSTDHSQIISGGSDGMVNIWESRNGSSFFNLAGHTQPVTAISVSWSGRVVSASASELFVWNTMRGQPEPIGAYHSIASWSSDSRYLLTQSGSDMVVLDGDTFTQVNRFPQSSADNQADWAGAGTSFTVIGAENPSVLILDAWLNIERGRFGQGVAQIAEWATNGVELSVWDEAGQLTVWSALDGTEKYTISGWQADSRSLAWVNGGQIALSNADGVAFVWDINSASVVDAVVSPSQSSPTITAQIAVSEQGNVLSIFDAQGGVVGQHATPFEQSMTDYGVAEIVASPNGEVIAGGVSFANAIGDTLYAVVLWNTQTGAQLAQLSGHDAPVVAVAFSPDGTQLATLDVNGVAYLWTVN